MILLFKKFKKMTTGKKIGTILISAIILLLVIYVIYSNFKPKALPEYFVSEVYRGDIQTTYETTGTVSSQGSEELTALNGVKVLSVNVSVGDRVKAGDVLATFDTSSLNKTLAEYRTAYNKAKEAYNASVSAINDSSVKKADIEKQIKALEKEIPALEAEVEKAKAQSEGQAQFVSNYTAEQLAALNQRLQQGGFTPEEIAQIISSMQSQNVDISADNLENAVQNSYAVKQITLSQKQSRLEMLKAQLSFVGVGTDDTVSGIYKNVMEQKKADYDNYQAMINKLNDGWTASADGIVTEVNLVAGEVFAPAQKTSTTTDISSLLGFVSGGSQMSGILNDIMSAVSSNDSGSGVGIKIENSGSFIAEFSVGKYDILKLKVGQKVKVTSLDSTYEGEVIYVSATASESNGLDISSIASTFTGGSSSSSSGALVKIKINNPDEKIIIGFDVDISIDTEKMENVLIIPIDAVVTEDGVNYVYTIDKDNKVTKVEVGLGAYSDEEYELKSGVEAGDRVVDNPKSNMADGNKISVKAK